ncbi:hypothetical protein R1sor_023230 [Riccia sorocarpa]|uniref:K Homology domain-containing protein n=1 Tax=Riccia sorocarpa TaxID=122646 RepID=A0ABD3GR92_9MARC
MAAVTVASHPEQPESPGLNRVTPDHRPPNAQTQKRGRDDETSTGEKKWAGWPGDNVFRLVVPVQKVGGIIGRKGEFVKKMCEETRARIKILEGVPGTSERIVLVSAREDPDLAVSPAMDGLLRVHRRVIEGSDPEGEDGHSEPRAGGGTIASRLLVAATQAGSLIGRQGATIKSIQDASGATVRVLPPEELPLCALADDRVVEIQGEARNVHRAMELVVSHLRKFLVDRSVLALFELNRAVTASQSQQQPSTGSWGGHSPANALPSNAGGPMGNNSHYGGASVPNDNMNYYQNPPEIHHHDTHHHHHGVSLYGRDPSIGSLSSSVAAPPPAPVITQMTQHMQIPLSYADAIIGTAGANISYMRRTSGATITIQETRGVPGEMTVEIHGSAAQVQTAQQLIQNFMAGASGAPSSTYNSVDTSYSSYANQNSLYSSAPSNSAHSTAPSYPSHYGNNSYGGY